MRLCVRRESVQNGILADCIIKLKPIGFRFKVASLRWTMITI